MSEIDYSPLWETMKKKNVSQYRLIKNGISSTVLDCMKNNTQLFPCEIKKLCEILDCREGDIVDFSYTKALKAEVEQKRSKRRNFILTTITSASLVQSDKRVNNV